MGPNGSPSYRIGMVGRKFRLCRGGGGNRGGRPTAPTLTMLKSARLPGAERAAAWLRSSFTPSELRYISKPSATQAVATDSSKPAEKSGARRPPLAPRSALTAFQDAGLRGCLISAADGAVDSHQQAWGRNVPTCLVRNVRLTGRGVLLITPDLGPFLTQLLRFGAKDIGPIHLEPGGPRRQSQPPGSRVHPGAHHHDLAYPPILAKTLGAQGSAQKGTRWARARYPTPSYLQGLQNGIVEVPRPDGNPPAVPP